MKLAKRLENLEQSRKFNGYRKAIIMDDLVASASVEEDTSILGLSEIRWGGSGGKVWMRMKDESLSELRTRIGREAGCLEGELCLFDAVRCS